MRVWVLENCDIIVITCQFISVFPHPLPQNHLISYFIDISLTVIYKYYQWVFPKLCKFVIEALFKSLALINNSLCMSKERQSLSGKIQFRELIAQYHIII